MKRIKFLSLALTFAATLSFATTSCSCPDKTDEEGTKVVADSTAKAEAKSDSKCGEGKCGEGKCGDGKTVEKDSTIKE